MCPSKPFLQTRGNPTPHLSKGQTPGRKGSPGIFRPEAKTFHALKTFKGNGPAGILKRCTHHLKIDDEPSIN
ncbi:hypothetical protein AMECASPLE_014866 [Ameca splendens]|uniref:Uncharacterized protein n=1 Tax=Ameca splendens TaxID=208324 RepID=A0ABV0Y1K0_9TELE